MNKAFVRETEAEPSGPDEVPMLPSGTKNYMTPGGHARMLNELQTLVNEERPSLIEVIAWAASNGDRSENGDYIYGKKRLREIDRRIRFLHKRLETAEVVDPARQDNRMQIYFGATVSLLDENGDTRRYSIVGVDETDHTLGRISWISPLARAMLKAKQGDAINFQSPAGVRNLEVLAIDYVALD